MIKEDKELLDRVTANKQRYTILVDNDAVHVQDNTKSDEDEDYWETFSEYGYEFIVELFQYLGFDADYV